MSTAELTITALPSQQEDENGCPSHHQPVAQTCNGDLLWAGLRLWSLGKSRRVAGKLDSGLQALSARMALALPFLLLIAAKDKWHKGIKILLAVMVFSVCYSRVILGAHYVSDVLAGVGMALICIPVATLLSNKFLRKMTKERFVYSIKIWALILLGLMIFLIVN